MPRFLATLLLLTSATTALGQAAPQQSSAPSSNARDDVFTRVAGAEATAAAARVHLRTTEDELSGLVRTQRYVFENSKPYREALADQQKAYARYDAARKDALAALEMDPEYTESRKIREDLAFKLSEAHAARKPDPAEIAGLSQYKQRVVQKMSAREAEQLSGSSAVADARRDLAAATARLDDLKRDFDVTLRTSNELASARKNWRNAIENMVASEVYADSAIRTANVLIDYSYFSQWISTYRPVVYNGGYCYPGYFGGYTPYNTTTPAAPAQSTGGGFGMLPGQ